MKKFYLLVGVLAFSAIAFASEPPAPPAPPRASNEMLTVKACDSTLRMPYFANFDLTRVYDVMVNDNGRGLLVNLAFRATYNDHGWWVDGFCKTNAWFNYDGSYSTCDECAPSNMPCNCIVAQCDREPIPPASTKGIVFKR